MRRCRCWLEPERSARRARWTLVALGLGYAIVQLDVSVVNVAVRSIGTDLRGGVSALQWVVNAYTITFAAFILTAGALSDRLGARRMLLCGFSVFCAASAACGLAPSLEVLALARAIQGIGAAALVPASLSLLNHTYDAPAGRARAIGLWLASASLALASGPLVGGVLIAASGWRAVFFINVPVAVVGIVLTLRYATETPCATDREVDVLGQLLAVATLALLVATMIEGGSRGFGSTVVIGGFTLATLAAVLLVLVEAQARTPMLPLSLFGGRGFVVAALVGMLINIGFYGLIFVLSLFFQRAQGLTPLQTGLALAPMMIGILVANLNAGRLNRRLGTRRTVTLGVIVALGACGALLGIDHGTRYGAMVGELFLLGASAGAIIPTITTVLMSSVDRTRSGVAAGALNTSRQTGSAVGVALFGSLLAGDGGLVGGVHEALAITLGLSIVIGMLAPLLR
jgi:MFS transporter, DHA2 family, methylenomycin A resistance protein